MGKKGAILGIFCAAAVMLAGCSPKAAGENGGAVRVWGPVSEASDTACASIIKIINFLPEI